LAPGAPTGWPSWLKGSRFIELLEKQNQTHTKEKTI
jgi:hypothetical protein